MPYPVVPVASAADAPPKGLTFSVKDMFDVTGYPTSDGSPFELARSGIRIETAAAVRILLEAGAVFADKAVMDEFAYPVVGRNVHFGTPVNGAAPDRLPRGSVCGPASLSVFVRRTAAFQPKAAARSRRHTTRQTS